MYKDVAIFEKEDENNDTTQESYVSGKDSHLSQG